MKKAPLAIALFFALAACGSNAPAEEAQPADMVDECYQEQAERYKLAAETARDNIESYVPLMIESFADTLEAAVDQDLTAMREAEERFQDVSDEFLTAGSTFAARMDRAEEACP